MTSPSDPGVGPGPAGSDSTEPGSAGPGPAESDSAARVLGPTVDDQTRCIHYSGPSDVIAIKFHCCGEFYPCFRCHADTADHALSVWPRAEFDTHAILCGVCRTTISITDYQATGACPSCGAGFNPGCSLHYPLYFEN